jgi:two-component system, cell cycle response regulator
MNEAGTPYGGFTVLVVDDSSTMRRLMDITLGQVGINVEFADCGNDALALVQQRRYDMVFLDVILPDVDGYRVCKTIKGNKVTRGTPVVMLTSRDTAFDKVRGKMSGADTYLTKPLDRAVLMHTINKHLAASGATTHRSTAR